MFFHVWITPQNKCRVMVLEKKNENVEVRIPPGAYCKCDPLQVQCWKKGILAIKLFVREFIKKKKLSIQVPLSFNIKYILLVRVCRRLRKWAQDSRLHSTVCCQIAVASSTKGCIELEMESLNFVQLPTRKRHPSPAFQINSLVMFWFWSGSVSSKKKRYLKALVGRRPRWGEHM